MICHPPLLLSVLVPYYLPALHLLTGPFFLFLFHGATWDSTEPRHSTDESSTAQPGTVPDPATVRMSRSPPIWKEGRQEGRWKPLHLISYLNHQAA